MDPSPRNKSRVHFIDLISSRRSCQVEWIWLTKTQRKWPASLTAEETKSDPEQKESIKDPRKQGHGAHDKEPDHYKVRRREWERRLLSGAGRPWESSQDLATDTLHDSIYGNAHDNVPVDPLTTLKRHVQENYGSSSSPTITAQTETNRIRQCRRLR